MLAKDMFPPGRDDPRGTFAAAWRETISGAGVDDGLDAASVRCAALRCTGIGGPTATVGLDPTGRDGYAAVRRSGRREGTRSGRGLDGWGRCDRRLTGGCLNRRCLNRRWSEPTMPD